MSKRIVVFLLVVPVVLLVLSACAPATVTPTSGYADRAGAVKLPWSLQLDKLDPVSISGWTTNGKITTVCGSNSIEVNVTGGQLGLILSPVTGETHVIWDKIILEKTSTEDVQKGHQWSARVPASDAVYLDNVQPGDAWKITGPCIAYARYTKESGWQAAPAK